MKVVMEKFDYALKAVCVWAPDLRDTIIQNDSELLIVEDWNKSHKSIDTTNYIHSSTR